MDVQGLARFPRFVAGKLQKAVAEQKVGQRNARLKPRQRRAQAEVAAVAECEMRIGIARDVEPLGSVELPGIAIRRADHRQHQLARRDQLAMHLDVALRRPHHPLQRRAVAQHLFDRRGEQFGAALKRANSPGCSIRQSMALLIRLVVVSWPPTTRSWKNPRISACVSRSPSISAATRLVNRSSFGADRNALDHGGQIIVHFRGHRHELFGGQCALLPRRNGCS